MPIFALFHAGSSRNPTSNSVLKDITLSEKTSPKTSVCVFTEIFVFLVQIVIEILILRNIFSKISFLVLDLVFLPLKYPKTPSSLQQYGSKKDL